MSLECSCDINVNLDDADIPKSMSCCQPTARKIHRCIECRRDILPGEIYAKEAGVWNGQFRATYETCCDCKSARDIFFPHGWLYKSIWPDIREFISDVKGEISSECIQALTPTARDRVCDMLEEVYEEIRESD